MNTINNISYFINQNIKMFNSFDNIYLFGSILNDGKIPNDVDILLIYSKYSEHLISDLNIICSVFADISELPIDFTILSIEEEKDTGFLKKLNSKYLKLK